MTVDERLKVEVVADTSSISAAFARLGRIINAAAFAIREAAETFARALRAIESAERYAIERLDIAESDIRWVDGSTITLWNRRVIELPDGWASEAL